MQIYNKLFIKQLFFNTENGDEVRKKRISTCRCSSSRNDSM